MEIYVDFPTWKWTAVLRSKKLVFDWKSQSVSQRNALDREKLGGDVGTRKSKESRQCWLG